VAAVYSGRFRLVTEWLAQNGQVKLALGMLSGLGYGELDARTLKHFDLSQSLLALSAQSSGLP
jgi:hypothetical protein